MFPYYSLEFFGRELRREPLPEAERFRLARLATEQQPRITTLQNWKLELITLLLKPGGIIILLSLARYLIL